MIYGLAEYRHMFNACDETKGQRFWSRFGFVAWGGVGAIGPGIFKLEGVLPNYGLGIRFEMQHRMNIRIDFGRDPIGNDMLVYMNVTEAF